MINKIVTFNPHTMSGHNSLLILIHYDCLSIACNCSELAVDESCDAVTGQCQCQEGAIGLKCDDCDFGYSG